MRFGNWRGVTLAAVLGLALVTASASPASADLFGHDIPRLVPAVDVNTGGPYYAPPVPYGHYAGKDLGGKAHKALGGLGGLLHHGGCGDGCGHDGGCGHGGGCGLGGGGCGLFKGHGLFSHGGDACGEKGCKLFGGHGAGQGLCGDGLCGTPGFATTGVLGSSQQPIVSSPQGVIPSSQCGEEGCGLSGLHHHKNKRGHGAGFGHGRGMGHGDPCGACGGKGCGLCGFLGHLKDKVCGACGGAGCGLCAKVKSLLGGLLHRDRIKYFVGPGGPVPITPGYVPYVITTRSPRDFLAFPPFTP